MTMPMSSKGKGDAERFCIKCDKMMPIECFHPKKRQYRCLKHLNTTRSHEIWSAPRKRAYFSLRTRAMQDMRQLGKSHVVFDEEKVMEMLATTNYKTHCFMPLDPEKPLSVPQNAVIVPAHARRFIMTNWRETRNVAKYRGDIRHVLLG
jgi:hypothetical protein